MPRKKAKKPVKPGEVQHPRRPRGDLDRSGRVYEGAVIEKCLIPPTRVAVWHTDRPGVTDEPVACGVLLGIQPHRDGRVPDLRVAVNQHTLAIPLDEVGHMCELRADQARPEAA